jgi:hypothetical protein
MIPLYVRTVGVCQLYIVVAVWMDGVCFDIRSKTKEEMVVVERIERNPPKVRNSNAGYKCGIHCLFTGVTAERSKLSSFSWPPEIRKPGTTPLNDLEKLEKENIRMQTRRVSGGVETVIDDKER